MSNSKNVLNKNYVSLEKYNKIKYDLYLKDNEIQRLEGEIYNRDIIIQDLYNKIIYWSEEYQKVSKNQNVNDQYKYDFANFKQMYIEFTEDLKQENNKLREQIIQNKDNIIQRLENDNERLENTIEKLKERNKKLEKDKDKLINKLIGVDDND